jgi:hypothetical protein
MFEYNKNIVDFFTLLHIVVPFIIGRYMGRIPKWQTKIWPYVFSTGLFMCIEPVEFALGSAGLVFFQEQPINILGDLLSSIPSSIIGVQLGRRDFRNRPKRERPAEWPKKSKP